MTISADTFSPIGDLSAAFCPPTVAGLDDDSLVAAQRMLSEIKRRVDAASAIVAAEIAHRSRRELGYEGLAQRLGARTPERLVQMVTGSTSREAQVLVRVGGLIAITDPTVSSSQSLAAEGSLWMSDVAAAVATGVLSVEAAEAIRCGLGVPDGSAGGAESTDGTVEGTGVTIHALTRAAEVLLREASALTVERLAARARELRAELDLDRVQQRENELREKRFLRLIPQSDGMTRLSGLLDPESAALVSSAYDAATSPRRGGPRFVEPTAVARAEDLVRDTRTTEQIAVDSFVELIRLGGAVDATTIVGSRRPAVQVLVTERDLRAHHGAGQIEGQSLPVSIQTVERHACENGTLPILFDRGQVINIGRSSRLFTRIQRLGLAARDGGCIFPGCDRPPSWCEAHHIKHWHRDSGRTDLADGVLLCRHHHMLTHNNGWRITRKGADYSLVPPATLDPLQAPIPARQGSPTTRRLAAAARGG